MAGQKTNPPAAMTGPGKQGAPERRQGPGLSTSDTDWGEFSGGTPHARSASKGGKRPAVAGPRDTAKPEAA